METQQALDELFKRVALLEQKRIYQQDIANDVVKMKHVGEGVRYIQTGLAADRPTTPAEPSNSCMIWFSYDSNVLSVYNVNTDSWKSVTLT